jgi:WD40 repeat protein
MKYSIILLGWIVLFFLHRCQAKEPPSGAGAQESLPSAAIARLGGLAFKYAEKNALLGFSPDGTRYYTHAWSNSISVWDAKTGEVVQRYTFPAEEQYVLAMSSDVKLFATWGEKTGLRVRAFGRAEPLHRFPDYTKNFRPHEVVFAPQNRVLAIADDCGGMRVYDLQTGERLPSPLVDGKYVGIALSDVWITGMHFTTDGRYLIVCKPQKSSLIWDRHGKRVVRDFGSVAHADTGERHVKHQTVLQAIVPDQRWITVVNDHPAHFFETHHAKDGSFHAGTWSTNHGTVRIGRLPDAKEVRSFHVPQEVRVAAVSTDGKLLATLGTQYSLTNWRLKVWDIEKERQLADLADVEEDCGLAFMPDNRTLVTCGNRSMRFWSRPEAVTPGSATLVEIRTSGDATEGVSALQFTPDGQQLLAASKAGVAVWDARAHTLLQRFGTHDSYAGNVIALAPQGDCLILMSHSSGQRWLRHGVEWTVAKAEPLECRWICRSLAFSPDGKQLAIGARQTSGNIGGEFPPTFEMLSAEDSAPLPIDRVTRKTVLKKDVSVLAYSADGGLLAIALGQRYSLAEKVMLLDTKNQYKTSQTFHFPKSSIHCLAFSPDGHLLAAGGGRCDDWDKKSTDPKDHGVALCPINDEEPLTTLTGHTRPVLALAFSRDGRWLVTGGEDHTIRVWEVKTGKEKTILLGHQGTVTAVAFSPDGRLLATGSEDTTVLLWDFSKVITRAR